MSPCEKEECYYYTNELDACGIPIGLKTLQHCEIGKCLTKQIKEKEDEKKK